jgi:hypothetical protein
LLGAGVELEPGPLRLAVMSGISQQAVQAPEDALSPALFQQRLSAAQVELGSEGGWHPGRRC